MLCVVQTVYLLLFFVKMSVCVVRWYRSLTPKYQH